MKCKWPDYGGTCQLGNEPPCAVCTERPASAEALARRFHETYERLAPEFAYDTRPETRTFDPESANGRLMIAVCDEVLRGEARKLEWACRQIESLHRQLGGLQTALRNLPR